MSKRSDRTTVAAATLIFLAGVGVSFVIAATWNVAPAVLCLIAGLGIAMILVETGHD